MQTIKCPQCKLVDWENAIVCNRCNYWFQPEKQQEMNERLSQNDFNENQAEGFESNQEHFSQESQTNTYQSSQTESFNDDNYKNHQQPNQGYQQQNYREPQFQTHQQPNHFHPPRNSKRKIKMAVTSMVLGVLSFPFFWAFWVAFLAMVLAIMLGTAGAVFGVGIGILVIPLSLILGIVALVKVKKYPNEYGGKGFAITGIVCSSLAILMLPIIAAIAIPNLLAARKSANEGGAISSLRKLSDAQTDFKATNQQRRCGTLKELGDLKLIDGVLAKGKKMGYRYMIVAIPSVKRGCEILATPVSKSTGTRSFYYSTEDNIIRAEDKKGEIADKNSPPLGNNTQNQPPQISGR